MATRGRALKNMVKRTRPEQGDLIAIQTWMRIGLERNQAIEIKYEGLRRQIVSSDTSGSQFVPSDITQSLLINAGKRALIEHEEAQLLDQVRPHLGTKVQIARREADNEVFPHLYDGGKDYVIQPGEIITGQFVGAFIHENGFLKDGIIELAKATSSSRPDMYAPPTSPLSVHHVFSQQKNGTWLPTITIESAP